MSGKSIDKTKDVKSNEALKTWPLTTWSFWLGIWSNLSKVRQEQLIILIKEE